jgi:transcriptional regulator with XRE-family HTH domain
MTAIKAESRAYFRALGAHIATLRKEQGMTQAELARAIGVSQQTVFAYELGDRRVSVPALVKLSRTFGVSMEELSGMTMPIRPTLRLSPAGMRHAGRYQRLSKTEQRFVKRIIDVLLKEGSRHDAVADCAS